MTRIFATASPTVLEILKQRILDAHFAFYIKISPVHVTLFLMGKVSGNPAFSAVAITSIPTASMEGLAWKGNRHDVPPCATTHSSHKRQQPPIKPAAK